jgi:VWFA-related protein
VPQSIAHFSRDELPLDIVFVVDESGSMSAVFEPLRQALLNSLVKLKTEDRVALFGFATDSKLATPFTKDKKAVARGVRGLRVGGSTQIYDALSQAATYMQKQAPQDRRIIVLISDDMPYPPQQESAAEKALRELQTTDVAVYKVRIAPALDIPALKVALQQLSALGVKVSVTIPETTEMPKQLTKIIEATGGVIADVNDLKGLPGAIDALVSLLKTRYTLGFCPNNAAGDTSYHKLDLRLTPGLGEKGKDYKILSKDGYYASPVH